MAMRNENAYNAYLSKELRKLHSEGLYHTKTSDRFTAGISDFLIWWKGKSIALEVKFIKEFTTKGDLLAHPFTGAQLTFLESIHFSGNNAYGLVAVGSEKRMYAIPWSTIPINGNWINDEFRTGYDYKAFSWEDTYGMLKYILG